MIERRYRIIAFDWDGTAVVGRQADATPLAGPLERLLVSGVIVYIVTGTKLTHIDAQLSPLLPAVAKQNLYVATNRGSEVFGFDAEGRPQLLDRRTATAAEDRALTELAEELRRRLVALTGLDFQIVHDRLNRRKVDLIPVPQWLDPPKSAMAELKAAVEERLASAGLPQGLRDAVALAASLARERGLDVRITSDVKHIEIGLTDKADALAWMLRHLARPNGISPDDILVLGDEFGPVGGLSGSDARMMLPELAGNATFISVGPEPAGVPPGVLHLGGGPARFREILHAQAALWPLSLPAPPPDGEEDPVWQVVEEGLEPHREDEVESLFTVANGLIGTRGALPERALFCTPATFLAGVYARPTPGALPELAQIWGWDNLLVQLDGEPLDAIQGSLAHRRVLDLRHGMRWRHWVHRDDSGRITRIEALWLASLANRHLALASMTITAVNHAGWLALETSLPGTAQGDPGREPLRFVQRPAGSDVVVAFAVADRLMARDGEIVPPALESPGEDGLTRVRWAFRARVGFTYRFDRMVAIHSSRDSAAPESAAVETVDAARARGIELEVRAHQRAWQSRWEHADVEIVGDDEAQRAVRFAVYHLVSAANPHDERTSIGARALAGDAYKGHVFWDTEIYMLPFYVLSHPATARALLMYRYHTLPAARAKAAAFGYRGALYAWESADTGEEVTPPYLIAFDGSVVPVAARDQEHHISADVAYGVWTYWHATADDAFLRAAGAEIMLETARFWASRVTPGPDGLHHILGVVGPDEYHESVDDNAYTNWMARWNLDQAAELARMGHQRWPAWWGELSARLHLDPSEPDVWRAIAASMYTGLDPTTGLIEQFRGFFALDEVDLPSFEPRTAPMDVILGRARTRACKVIKQADVVLLIHLLWDRVPPEVRAANFLYYEGRTAHGSSLSPSIHAAVAARLGLIPIAERYFRQSAEVDLGNNMGNVSGGVHAAALGGLWQAVLFGFAGVDTAGDVPVAVPHLPPSWSRLRFALCWRRAMRRFSLAQERALGGPTPHGAEAVP